MHRVTSRARAATAEARRSEGADPSCSSTTLSAEEYAALLDTAMRYPDQQVGLCVAAMVSVSLTAGFRSGHSLLPGAGGDCASRATAYASAGDRTQRWQGESGRPNDIRCAGQPQAAPAGLPVIATMTDPLVKTKVMHLMRCSGLADLAAAACSMDVMRVWGRWAKADGAVRSRNQSGAGKADHSGMHAVESILYLAETFWQSSPFMLQRYGLSWWALQLPVVRAIVGSYGYRVFEQEVLQAELHCSARPLSPQLTEAFGEIKKQEATDDIAPLLTFR
ncbi:hypothetical protein WJX72_000856 [[Myrmecia] bisecta]|uniref:Uncharacterized protein n=1 Tax=[Myrmecia] bisecta TaxID=41462 RepID=A0AAW1QP15_9CHLO